MSRLVPASSTIRQRQSPFAWWSNSVPISSTMRVAASARLKISFATASTVRPLLGISPSAWEEARTTMGDGQASVVLAAILQRGATPSRVQEATSRNLARRAAAGGVLSLADADGPSTPTVQLPVDSHPLLIFLPGRCFVKAIPPCLAFVSFGIAAPRILQQCHACETRRQVWRGGGRRPIRLRWS